MTRNYRAIAALEQQADHVWQQAAPHRRPKLRPAPVGSTILLFLAPVV